MPDTKSDRDDLRKRSGRTFRGPRDPKILVAFERYVKLEEALVTILGEILRKDRPLLSNIRG